MKINYNYHTHTSLCGHAGNYKIEDFIKAAREEKIDYLGFSDHIPTNEYTFYNAKGRMHITEVDKYIYDIKKHNLLCGFEVEYDVINLEHILGLREKVDYMILGQHYVSNGFDKVNPIGNIDYPLIYALEIIKALDSGIFDIVAHPDKFLQYRNTIKDYKKYESNVKKASFMIAKKAEELKIPLEINLSRVLKKINYDDLEFQYPHSLFFNEVAKTKAKVIFGVDVHNPLQFKRISKDIDIINSKIKLDNLNIVEFHPIKDRNKKLDLLLKDTRLKVKPFLSYLNYENINYLIDQIENNINKISKRIENVFSDNKISNEEKQFKILRFKNSININKEILIKLTDLRIRLKK